MVPTVVMLGGKDFGVTVVCVVNHVITGYVSISGLSSVAGPFGVVWTNEGVEYLVGMCDAAMGNGGDRHADIKNG